MHWLRGMFWHCSCGKNSQRSRGTLTQLWRGTFWQFSRGTRMQFWRGTLRHSWRGKEVHCVSGTVEQSWRGTFRHVLNERIYLYRSILGFLSFSPDLENQEVLCRIQNHERL
jgi:hypothetical protein